MPLHAKDYNLVACRVINLVSWWSRANKACCSLVWEQSISSSKHHRHAQTDLYHHRAVCTTNSVVQNNQIINVQYNLHKYCFLIYGRVIQTWNSIPDSVTDVSNINTFKNKLDKLPVNEKVQFNWRYDLTSSGSYS